MNTLVARPYAGEADLQPIVDLLEACEVVDRLEDNFSLDELRHEMTDPGLDPARDVRLWEDARGALTGFAVLWIREPQEVLDGFLWIKVHPEARGGRIEPEIIAWAEERIREAATEHGVVARLRTATRDTDAARAALLEAHDFTPVRHFFRMARPLDRPIPEPQFPPGFTLRHLAGEHEAEAWVAMFNESFIDHWNHHPMTVEEFRYARALPHYQAEQDLIAIAPDGTFAAFCYCLIDSTENARTGRNEGWIRVLGTRRSFRRIGLGRAMLLAGLHRLKADGAETAVLGVDAANPTGALRLYEEAGFHRIHTFISYGKEVSPHQL